MTAELEGMVVIDERQAVVVQLLGDFVGVLREAQESGEVLSFQETDPDGTVIEFDAQVSVKRTGGGVNGAIGFDLTVIVQSDISYTDPA